ncbi:hypothetical protein [Paenibacillus chibensis]|uniref:hypothetical protein n=1 Tax=Paenibacillus chibensis TaxID=59846 RepID=UPI000FDB2EF9|nr:hypothetical protein [Paenibacillus chibensis]MEC0371686.1 hypothetical protein [Paenibacillus chibensis]
MYNEHAFKINFGKYALPRVLRELSSIDKSLKEEGRHLDDGLFFYLVHDQEYRYFNTPCDVVVFGNIGADGIHYGLLTDFGTVRTLDEAPVVCVTPMDSDCPVRVIAENLEHFLAINMNESALFYNHFPSEEAYDEFVHREVLGYDGMPYLPDAERECRREEIQQRVRERIRLPQIDFPYRYVQEQQAKRDREAWIHTQARLHVLPTPGQAEVPYTGALYSIGADGIIDTDAIGRFLEHADPPAVKALIRDIQMHVLSGMTVLQDMLESSLRSIGLGDEAERMRLSVE